MAKKIAKKKVAKKVAKKKTAKKPEKKATAKKAAPKTAKKAPTKKETNKATPKKEQKTVDSAAVSKKEAKVASKKMPPREELAEVESKVQDEIADLSENFSWEDISEAISSLDFFVDHRSDDCAEKGCENLRTTQQYCRMHYIANWQDIKRKREILKEGKLQEYIEELIGKYPPKYIESILADLQDDKDFFKALNELNIASELDYDEEVEGIDSDDDDGDDIEVETRSFASTKSRYEED